MPTDRTEPHATRPDGRTASDVALSTRLVIALALIASGCSLMPTPSPELLNPGAGVAAGDSDASPSGPASDAGDGEGDGAALASFDPTAYLAAVAGGAYRTSSAFVHVTLMPYPSSAAVGSSVDEWVSVLGASDYLALSPDGGPAQADLPPGAMIVRAVLDATGTVSELTLLVKGPPGFNPAIGDWWWGVTDPLGTPQTSDAGVLLGRLTQCYGCHLPRASEDFLFGAPAGDRASGAPLDAGPATDSAAPPPGVEAGTDGTDAGADGMDAGTDGMDAGQDGGNDSGADAAAHDGGYHHRG